ncbi:50S ribosomal protein L35 [Alicyclobacillus vulcanalis]|uniref:Large ribosomal subunit protein bL35 n=1 Tax=Alicyclobacillus vulcanalis TaxID=252246 RepID=A0A1N7PC09_9BACL|nr:50S ribosomal protein L35 [Alicyclobacillus vulcanalis]SIT08173.1 LSU ribosomal protein L35P [Alicyclobacillus vulcanalis]
MAKTKMKTHSGLKKRVKRTGTGLLKRTKAFGYHKLEHKSPARKRRLSGTTLVSRSDVKRIKQLVVYK